MAVVSTAILRDISGLGDQLIQSKRLGLRNASSRIDVSSLRPEIRAELLSPPRINFSVTPTSVNRMHSDIEVQNQTLNGSEPKIYHTFEGGNMKLSLLPFDNVLEIWGQNLYGSESSINYSYRRKNLLPLSAMGLQNRITEIHYNPQYGSDSNVNYDERRISEFSESNR